MHLVKRALKILGFDAAQEDDPKARPDYFEYMRGALNRIRMAELQIHEATTLEDLDIGRSALLAAQAEVQQLVRSAKRERGITVRPISETEELHRNMRDLLNNRVNAARRQQRTGTGDR